MNERCRFTIRATTRTAALGTLAAVMTGPASAAMTANGGIFQVSTISVPSTSQVFSGPMSGTAVAKAAES